MNLRFPFKDKENSMVIVCMHILENEPILYVSHDIDDGTWQFLCGKNHSTEDGRIISLGETYKIDKSIAKIADLPLGYVACRKSIKSPWVKLKRQI